MAAEAVVRVRIDSEVKEQAAAVLAEMGLSIPDLIRTLLRRVAAEGTVPFEGEVPNAETIAAIKELESGYPNSYATVRELMDALKAGD
jgi:DNA-damage-inducible protein J